MKGLMLAFDPHVAEQPLLDEVREALDSRAIPYGIVFVGGYVRPRLDAGGGELEGYDIIDRIDEVEALLST